MDLLPYIITALGAIGFKELVIYGLRVWKSPKEVQDTLDANRIKAIAEQELQRAKHQLDEEKQDFEHRLKQSESAIAEGERIRDELRKEVDRWKVQTEYLQDQFTKLQRSFLDTLGLVGELRMTCDSQERQIAQLKHERGIVSG
jgi:chromosome segregation ATPase